MVGKILKNIADGINGSLGPTITLTCCLLLFALVTTALLTRGFEGWTTEMLRRQAIMDHPLPLPSLQIMDETGKRQRLDQYVRLDGRVVLIDFIYTRCNSICTVLGEQFQQAQTHIEQHGLQQKVRLLSISFDAQHDTPAVLASYASRMHADPAVWHFATVTDRASLDLLLRQFGIVVIPDGYGGFIHNAAIHVVDRNARLEHIYDLDDFDMALAHALDLYT
ncbi:hypothetical protein GCM10010971_00120 [Silvimonas amylolytica]|uniref:Protein SCO1/2 n=1 Tax=Silvimonas amylolytica TaxID=449663 RepID=A0ABQ2PF52_9NEIS|nr:hypothetical protein GCM10010971_00120 [Silvimonas amylolytica]